MGRFRCPVSAQRFLAAFTRTWNLFRPRRRSFTAAGYGAALQDRFAAWQVAAELRPQSAQDRSALSQSQVRPPPPLAPSS